MAVKLPTQPFAEFTFAAGIRPKIATIDFDFGLTYFAYPGRLPGETGINYWEAVVRGDEASANRSASPPAAYSRTSQTPAWANTSRPVGYDVPPLLPPNLGISFTTAAGYSWFGNQAPTLGGFPLPAYLNWQAGRPTTRPSTSICATSTICRKRAASSSPELNARPGGRVDPVTNPAGLASNWCGATFVMAGLRFEQAPGFA